jgi:hypothetical protein
MSRPCFLAGQDFNEHIIRGVLRREPAIDFVRLRDVGLESRSDAEILAYAAAENRIIVSHDVNTMSAAAHDCLAAKQRVASRAGGTPPASDPELEWRAASPTHVKGRGQP